MIEIVKVTNIWELVFSSQLSEVISSSSWFRFHLAIESAPNLSFILCFVFVLRPWSKDHFHNERHPRKSIFFEEVC